MSMAFERVFVSSDFKAMPCCYIADPKTKTMADLNLEKDPLSFGIIENILILEKTYFW